MCCCMKLSVFITLMLRNRWFEYLKFSDSSTESSYCICSDDSAPRWLCLHNGLVRLQPYQAIIMYLNPFYSFKHQHKAIWGSVEYRHMFSPTVSGDWGEYIRIDQHVMCARKASHALPHVLEHIFLSVRNYLHLAVKTVGSRTVEKQTFFFCCPPFKLIIIIIINFKKKCLTYIV